MKQQLHVRIRDRYLPGLQLYRRPILGAKLLGFTARVQQRATPGIFRKYFPSLEVYPRPFVETGRRKLFVQNKHYHLSTAVERHHYWSLYGLGRKAGIYNLRMPFNLRMHFNPVSVLNRKHHLIEKFSANKIYQLKLIMAPIVGSEQGERSTGVAFDLEPHSRVWQQRIAGYSRYVRIADEHKRETRPVKASLQKPIHREEAEKSAAQKPHLERQAIFGKSRPSRKVLQRMEGRATRVRQETMNPPAMTVIRRANILTETVLKNRQSLQQTRRVRVNTEITGIMARSVALQYRVSSSVAAKSAAVSSSVDKILTDVAGYKQPGVHKYSKQRVNAPASVDSQSMGRITTVAKSPSIEISENQIDNIVERIYREIERNIKLEKEWFGLR